MLLALRQKGPEPVLQYIPPQLMQRPPISLPGFPPQLIPPQLSQRPPVPPPGMLDFMQPPEYFPAQPIPPRLQFPGGRGRGLPNSMLYGGMAPVRPAFFIPSGICQPSSSVPHFPSVQHGLMQVNERPQHTVPEENELEPPL